MKSVVFEKVTVRYHYDQFDALSDLSFEVRKGETVSLILGEQGGKTTTAKLVMGLVEPISGKILADGGLLGDLSADKRGVAYICFPPLSFKTTVFKNVLRVLRLKGLGKTESKERAGIALKKFGLDGFSGKKASCLDEERLLELSLARAWCKRAEFFIIDGPTDNAAVDKILGVAAELDASVLLLCDSASVARGRIVNFLPDINLTEEI